MVMPPMQRPAAKQTIPDPAQCSTIRNTIPRTNRKRTYTPSRNLFVFRQHVIPSGVTNGYVFRYRFPTFRKVCEMVCKGVFFTPLVHLVSSAESVDFLEVVRFV